MAAFRYKHGDRPLEGYTIQRAAGRGGFGEVYYAVSDSGREVALKVIQGYEQIELRGVSQCMNLKSPHLVTIFDVKYNEEGVPFVIMEFVSGPSLRQLIDESPGGLGTQKAAFFLREIGKGLTYLHDCGIVHRDLKPGNIFYENGYAKIGDYGLSKAISSSQHSCQTVTVGTVHYMAPEIGMGRYDKSIDIYAMGAVLYEMLTGQVPYLGGSPAEVLMKHMSAEVNVQGIEEPFATVIKKAMAKDPAQRYQSIQEMVEAIFGAEHVRQSVSCFSPDSLSLVAGRVAAQVGVGVAVGGSSGPPPLPPRRMERDAWQQLGDFADRAGNRLNELGDRMAAAGSRVLSGRHLRNGGMPEPAPGLPAAVALEPFDPIPARQRKILAGVAVAVVSIGAGMLGPLGHDGTIPAMVFTMLIAGGATLGLLVANRYILPKLVHEAGIMRHLAAGGLATVGAILASFLVVATAPQRYPEVMASTWLAVIIPLFVLNWERLMSLRREQRVAFGHTMLSALFSLVLAGMFGASPPIAIGAIAATSLATQVASAWEPPAMRRRRRGRGQQQGREDQPGQGGQWMQPTGVRAASPSPAYGVAAPAPASAVAPPAQIVPGGARVVWAVLAALLVSLGPILIAMAASSSLWREDECLMTGFGIGMLGLGVFSLIRAFTTQLRSWWSYLIRPLLLYFCAQTMLISAIMLGNLNYGSDETLIAIFFIIFPILLGFLLLFVRPGGRHGVSAMRRDPQTQGLVPGGARVVWAVFSALLLSLGPVLITAASYESYFHEEECMMTGFGIGMLGMGLFCLMRAFTLQIQSWWTYLIRPVLIYMCAQSVLISGIFMGNMHLRNEEMLLGVFFIIFPILVAMILLFVRPGNRLGGERPSLAATPPAPPAPPAPAALTEGVEFATLPPQMEAPSAVSADAATIVTPPGTPAPPPLPDAPPPSWTAPPSQPSPAVSAWTAMPSLAPAMAAIPALFGSLVLLVAIGLGLLMALDVPGFVGAGIPDPKLPAQIAHDLGSERWPEFARTVGYTLVYVIMFIAAVLFMTARRRQGPMHMLRAPLGVAGVVAGLNALDSALRGEWRAVFGPEGQVMPVQSVQVYFEAANRGLAIFAMILMLTGLIVLIWPARTWQKSVSHDTQESAS